MFVKLKEFHHIILFKQPFIILHHSFNVVFHLLQLFGGQTRFYLFYKTFLHHHTVVNCLHLHKQALFLALETCNCVVDVL